MRHGNALADRLKDSANGSVNNGVSDEAVIGRIPLLVLRAAGRVLRAVATAASPWG